MSIKRITRRDVLAAGGQGAVIAGLGGLTMGLPGGRPANAQAERVLRFAAGDFGGNRLDPSLGKGETQACVCCMYDGWFPRDEITGQLKPGPIKAWEVAPDGLTWTFHLRDDVIFHDGSKFTVDDIIFSLEMAQREEAWQFDLTRILFGYPAKTEKIDDYTLRIITPNPAPRLDNQYSVMTTPNLWILPKAYVQKNGLDYFRKNPIGTGLYKFVRLVPNDTLEFEAVSYKHWSGVVPDFKRVIINLVPEEATRLFLLEKGQVDATHATLEGAVNEKKKGFTILTGAKGQSQLNFIGTYLPEGKSSPLSDVRVRQALSLAINRQELCDTLLGGLGTLPQTQQAMNITNNDVKPWLAEKWIPRFKQLYRYDPVEAKRLLTEANYNGAAVDIWVAPDSSAPFLPELMTALANYWSKIGFKANIVSVDSAAWAAARRPPRSMQMVGKAGVSATSLAKATAIERLQYWTTAGATLNLFTGSPDEKKIDELYTGGLRSVDAEEYTQLCDKGLELTTPTYTCVSLVDAPLPFIIGPRVNAVMSPGSSYFSLYFGLWKYTGKEKL